MMSECLLSPIDGAPIKSLKKSLSHVRHLSFRSTRYLTDASFHLLLDLMPNVTSLSLAGCSYLQFHHGIFSRFHTPSIDFSPSVLTFQNVLACMMKCKSHFTSLDLSQTLVNALATSQLVELYADCLVELRFNRCDQLNEKAFSSMTNFKHLRVLSFSGTSQLVDWHIERILEQMPQLEHLDLSGCFRLHDATCVAISKLERYSFLFGWGENFERDLNGYI